MKTLSVLAMAALLATSALAKLSAPSDEAKAKAAEAAAKTAWSGKVEAYKLCKAQDKVAAEYRAHASKAAKPASGIAACTDPGPFVYAPGGAGQPPAAAPAKAAPAAPAKKKA